MTVALVDAATLANELSAEDDATLARLTARLRDFVDGGTETIGGRPRRRLGARVLDTYYQGEQHLEQLGLAVPDDLRRFVTIVGWPGTQVDSVEERCDVEGFRLPGKSEADTALADVWQANDLDDESHMGHVDSLALGRSYACVGAGDDPELPKITVESPMEMVHEYSPRLRDTSAAARIYQDDSSGEAVQRATLYTRDATTWLVHDDGRWRIEDRDEHGLGRCPVVPLVNRGRSHARYGVSEMLRIITLTDAAARALTNAQVATELMALPQRYAAGMTAQDFTDPKTGEQVAQWDAYFGAVWGTKNPDAKFGQFSAADLTNFANIVNHYAQLVAGLTGLPMRFLGQLSANPPSADGIRADEARLVSRALRSQRSWGASWELVMRLARQFQRRGVDDPKLASMETLWAAAATPTRAQDADAGVKLYQSGITPLQQTRRDLGYTSVQISNMEREDTAKAAADKAAAEDAAKVAAHSTAPPGAASPTSGQQPAAPTPPAAQPARPATPAA